MCTVCVHFALARQKKASAPLGLESQMVMSLYVNAWTLDPELKSMQEQWELLTIRPYLFTTSYFW